MDLEEIEDLISYNLSYEITPYETLELIDRLDLIEYFNDWF